MSKYEWQPPSRTAEDAYGSRYKLALRMIRGKRVAFRPPAEGDTALLLPWGGLMWIQVSTPIPRPYFVRTKEVA